MAGRGTVGPAEFADLQTVAANLHNGIATSSYVASIFYQLVDGSQANASFTGGQTGTPQTLGDLKAGTTADQMNELIGKWFLGSDMPDPTIPADGKQVTSPIYPTYASYAYPLFGNTGAPQISDIAQGSVGDCELCSGLIETLLNHPGQIQSMFVDDGNGIYGVRFYVNGTETWVTVNDQLPVYRGSLVFNNAYVADPTSGLWADLAEKAYAQLSATGNIDHPPVNSYQNIASDTAFDVLTNLTDASSIQYLDSTSAYWNAYKNIVIEAVNQHDDVILETGNKVNGTFDAAGKMLLVSNHAYAVTGYDSATGDFIVRNPWGTDYGTQTYVTTFEVSMSDIASSAVQGDFALDNSAAPNVVFTGPQLMIGLSNLTYTSFQAATPVMGARSTVALAPLFQVQDTAGLPVTQYKFQLVGSGAAIALNGAADLATAAQQPAGEIVVSAADLAKLTLTTGAAGDNFELFLSANDGTGWATPFEMHWAIDSQAITVLPAANPMAAPSTAIPLAGLFQLAGSGASGGSPTYTFSMEAGQGSFNLNGATNLSTGSATRIEVSAADLAKVTYTTPAGSGVAVIDVSVTNGSQSSDVTQVPIDVGYSVSAALQAFKSGTVPFQIGVADGAASIFTHLDALESMMPNWNLLGVLVTDTSRQTETIGIGQYMADQGVLSILSGNYALDVTGATVAQAQALLSTAGPHLSGVQIADSAAEIFAGLAALQGPAAAGQITGITLTDSGSVTESVTAAQLGSDAAVLNDISGGYRLDVSGSAASVAGDLAILQGLAAKGVLGSVTLTDSGTPDLSITAADLAADGAVLNAISGNYTITVAAGSAATAIDGPMGHATTVQFSGAASQYTVTAANGSITVSGNGVTDHLSNVAAIQFTDVTEIVADAPGTSNAVTTGNVTELYSAVLGREPDVAGLAFYQAYLQKNPATPLQQFAEWFLGSSEYGASHSYAESAAGDTQFITDSYQNLLHRTPLASEVSYYENKVLAPAVAGLSPGTPAYAEAQTQAHALMLVYFSGSSEFLSDVQITASTPAGTQHWLLIS